MTSGLGLPRSTTALAAATLVSKSYSLCAVPIASSASASNGSVSQEPLFHDGAAQAKPVGDKSLPVPSGEQLDRRSAHFRSVPPRHKKPPILGLYFQSKKWEAVQFATLFTETMSAEVN